MPLEKTWDILLVILSNGRSCLLQPPRIPQLPFGGSVILTRCAGGNFFSVDCISSVTVHRKSLRKKHSCNACKNLRKWTALHPEHLGETSHEGCLPVGADLAKASSKSQELCKAVLTLFSSGNPKSRYLMLLELSIRYGEQLLKYQNEIPKQAMPDKKRPPFHFNWRDWEDHFEFLVHIQTLMGKKLSQLWRGNTKQGLWYAHFPFPSHSTIKNYRRKLIPHPIT